MDFRSRRRRGFRHCPDRRALALAAEVSTIIGENYRFSLWEAFGEGERLARLTCPSTSRTIPTEPRMLKQAPLLLLLLGSAFPQAAVEVHLDDIKGPAVKCTTDVPQGFACAIFFAADPPIHDGIDIASVVGGNSPYARSVPVIREVSLILDGTLYTAVYEPPL